MTGESLSRRALLNAIGGAGVASVALGSASAKQTGRHIVGTSTQAATDAARRRAGSVHRVLEFGDIGQAVAGEFSEEALENLAKNPNVRYTEADGTMEAIAQTLPWGIDRVDAETVHAAGETGDDDGGSGGDGSDDPAGGDVAIIDTGIDSDHPDLSPNLGAGYAVVSAKGPYAEEWDDDEGHGTHCAGIADAADNSEGVVGVSTAARLHAVKVLDKNGSGSFSDVAEGIRWVADQGYDVGSLSLGASSGSQAVEDACQYAHDNGVLLVAAAGNAGPCSNCVGYPAAYATVMAVAATDSDDSLAGYSSTGSEVEIAAPGSNIYSTYAGGEYATLSGTSMACPHVSGAGAQLMDNGYSNAEARDQLTTTAEDIGLSAEDGGSGLLDVEAAVGGSTDSAPGVSWATPTDGDTVSGSVTVQIAASDSEDGDDSLAVTYSVDGGSARSTAYNDASGYYEDEWDSTGVSDGEHALEATATDSANNTSSSTITVTTDNTESTPAVDGVSVSEVETSDSDAEFDVSWSVSDSDGNLSSVELALTDETAGETEDSASVSVSGGDASGTTRLVASGDDGAGNGYTVAVTVTDGAGNSGSGSISVSETETTNAAPSATVDSVADDSNPAWNRYTVGWSASDEDGNLDAVIVELLDSGGSVLDAARNDVSGSSASGSNEIRAKRTASSVTVTATDSDGESGSDSQSV